jgi:hypothetical protein
VLVAASGGHRVDEKAVAAALGEGIARASADFVRERTGFAIGGVPPIGHLQPVVAWWTRRSSRTRGSGRPRGGGAACQRLSTDR